MELDKNSTPTVKLYPNGDIYKGIIINDHREKKGTLIRNKTSTFNAELNLAIKHRLIIFYCADKESAKKKFPSQKINDIEIFYYEGDKYEGEFNNDLIEGKGIMTWVNGNKYEGEFKNNFFDGEGRLTFATKSYYQGQFKEGMQVGKGIFSYSNGDKYEGEWNNGLKEGQGRYEYHNGDIYVGQWKKDIKEGNGIFIYANKDKFSFVLNSE